VSEQQAASFQQDGRSPDEPGLRTGKLPVELLRRLVLSRLGARRPETLVRAGVGLDAAAVAFGPWACVLKVDPITAATAGAGRLAVVVACNDLAAMGAEPIGVLPTVLLPAGSRPSAVEALAGEVDRAAWELGVEVLGGHTEVSPGLSQPVVVMAAVGRARPDRLLGAAGARPGDALVLTKAAALEGTSILAHDCADRLRGRVPEALLAEARAYAREVGVVREALAAAALGATALHDPTEGGVLGALWEVAEASGTGFRVLEERIPVRAATRAICAALRVDPLRLMSSGALLVACPDGPTLARRLGERGVPAAVIGAVTGGGRELVRPDGTVVAVPPVGRDELYRVLERRRRRRAATARPRPGGVRPDRAGG
jgi:hydrogenase maturation factor